MRWDEEVFGLEYDLDVYMIVAVGDFNMGAMENKGLNIFNAKYVLAKPDTATDDEYEAIEAVIAPRVLPQLDRQPRHLPRLVPAHAEGRAHGLPRSAVHQPTRPPRAVKRIQRRRGAAHEPVRRGRRPDGAPDPARVATSRWTTSTPRRCTRRAPRWCGSTTRCSARTASGAAWISTSRATTARPSPATTSAPRWPTRTASTSSRFERWYAQARHAAARGARRAGTPSAQTLHAAAAPVAARGAGCFAGRAAADPGADGPARRRRPRSAAAPGRRDAARRRRRACCCSRSARRTFTFEGVAEQPGAVALARLLGAGEARDAARARSELAFLFAHDSDPVSRWDAGQTLAQELLLELARDARGGPAARARRRASSRRSARVLDDPALDGSLRALMLALPNAARAGRRSCSDGRLRLAARSARVRDRRARARAPRALRGDRARAAGRSRPTGIDRASIDRRRLRNTALRYLAALGEPAWTAALAQPVRARRQHDRPAGGAADPRRPARRGARGAARALLRAVEQRPARARQVVHGAGALDAHRHLRPRRRARAPRRLHAREPEPRCARWSAASRAANPLRFHAADGRPYAFLADSCSSSTGAIRSSPRGWRRLRARGGASRPRSRRRCAPSSSGSRRPSRSRRTSTRSRRARSSRGGASVRRAARRDRARRARGCASPEVETRRVPCAAARVARAAAGRRACDASASSTSYRSALSATHAREPAVAARCARELRRAARASAPCAWDPRWAATRLERGRRALAERARRDPARCRRAPPALAGKRLDSQPLRGKCAEIERGARALRAPSRAGAPRREPECLQ